MTKQAKQIHADIQADDGANRLNRNRRFLKYDAIGMRGDAHEGVANGGAEAYIKSVKASNKLPYSGIGLLQSKSVDDFKPVDIIMSTRKLQGALKMKEALKYLPPDIETPIDEIPSFPQQIRSKSQFEEDNKGRDARRFTLKMDR